MKKSNRTFARAISGILLMTTLFGVFSGCSDPENVPVDSQEPTSSLNLTDTATEDESMYTSSNYVKKYGDIQSANQWIEDYIKNSDKPPVTFQSTGKSSHSFSWEKEFGEIKKVVYFENEAKPSESTLQDINYVCKELGIRIKLTLITYTDYPVVEYTAVLYNEVDGNSPRISNLLSVDSKIESKTGDYLLHASRGANTAYNDFEPVSFELTKSKHFEVTNGKPTSTYIPYFNLENRVENTGTISIINWQGNWKADFSKTDSGITLKAGQYSTDMVLQKGESIDFPGTVLLFYKGDRMNGQNVYRRWLYSCNQFREQGKHMKETNVLVCSPQYMIHVDRRTLDLCQKTGLIEYIDKYNIDGGWYDTQGQTWFTTGNWYTLKTTYPKGISQLSDYVHDAGLKFAVWYEPERVAWGTWTTDQLKDIGGLIVVGSDGKAVTDYSKVSKGNCYVVLDYSNPEVVKWVIDLLNTQFKENKIDQYRQDFNLYPADHWTALDRTRKDQLGIPRTGYTENKYCRGYLEVYAGILAENPEMYIDACASGGMRNDLSTIRYSFMHTRSDYWADIESAQLQTYGSSMWFMYWGTGFSSADLNDYDVRSHLSNSIGIGISKESQADALKNALTDWKHLASYLFWDYYPLSDYVGSSKQTMSLQYDSPEEGKGMFITYFRKNDTFVATPRGLDPNASYRIWNMDDKEGTLCTMKGAEIMKGITITSKASTAIVYEYELVEGQDTTEFQTEFVKTGKGSNGYDPDLKNGKIIKVTIPEVNVKYENSMSDENLKALYNINDNNKIKLLGSDYRTTGLVYSISENIYNELIFATGEFNGWRKINKSKFYITTPDGTVCPLTTWDSNGGMFRNVQPLAKKIDNTYFLWMANILPFADDDGQWKSSDCIFSWDTLNGAKNSADARIDFKDSNGRFTPVGKDTHTGKGKIYKIDQAIFESFCYTGNGLSYGDVIWNEIELSSIGIVSVREKAPAADADINKMTKWLSALSSDEVSVYARKDGQDYYLWIQGSAKVEALNVCQAQVKRAIFVWKDRNGDINEQGIFFPA